MELEEQLLNYLQKKHRNISLEEIMREFNHDDNILEAIVRLEKGGKIFRNKKNEFQAWHNGLGRVFGTIRITMRGAGILKEESGNITFIHKDFLNGALTGDKVIVKDLKMIKPNGKGKERQEGKVERILQRQQEYIVCEVVNHNGCKSIKSLTENKNLKIRVEQEKLKEYIDGDYLSVKIGLNKNDDCFPGVILKRICHKDDPDRDLRVIATSHGFEYEFSDEVKGEVKNIPRDISNEDITKRVDLRNKIIFTIDDDDTKDIDDAISLEILPNGNYKLGVHIADVSHYVKPSSEIYKEALKRGTSLYMLSSVIPMLPRELSNGICSLNPNEDRLTKSCEMEIDSNGNIINSKIFDSVIKSRKKMTYTKVNEILEKGIIHDGYEKYADILKEMHHLSEQMNKRRNVRGSSEFDKNEIKIKTDLNGKVKDIKVLKRKSAEVLIENFMLSANEAVATTIARKHLPFIYRVHDKPNSSKLLEVIDIISNNNSEIKKTSMPLSSSRIIQLLLNKLRNYQTYPVYSDMILHCMSKAEYSNNNIGHFGLAIPYYTHFTSPIRRFPDLLVHQLLNVYSKEKISNLNLNELNRQIESFAIFSSERERAAKKAEYEANDMKTAEYMSDHIGEKYSGIIIDITDKGINVVLDNLIEGYVALRDIEPKSFYKFYCSKKMLMDDNKNFYQLGDKIIVRVKSSNVQQRKINFTALGHVSKKNTSESVEKSKIKELGD